VIALAGGTTAFSLTADASVHNQTSETCTASLQAGHLIGTTSASGTLTWAFGSYNLNTGVDTPPGVPVAGTSPYDFGPVDTSPGITYTVFLTVDGVAPAVPCGIDTPGTIVCTFNQAGSNIVAGDPITVTATVEDGAFADPSAIQWTADTNTGLVHQTGGTSFTFTAGHDSSPYSERNDVTVTASVIPTGGSAQDTVGGCGIYVDPAAAQAVTAGPQFTG